MVMVVLVRKKDIVGTIQRIQERPFYHKDNYILNAQKIIEKKEDFTYLHLDLLFFSIDKILSEWV